MLLWFMLRQAAIMRYSVWNTLAEGSDPKKWEVHKDAIKKFYGF
ncbi:MAG: hypothetical protein ACM3IH_10205 [Sphingobacteriales bacterium]